jgi:hypothetical protein
MDQYALERSVVLERVLRREMHRWGSVSSIKRRPHGRNMKVTDSHWSRVMVHRGPLISHVDVVWILHSAWPINPGHDWLKYILSMVFRLVLAGGGCVCSATRHREGPEDRGRLSDSAVGGGSVVANAPGLYVRIEICRHFPRIFSFVFSVCRQERFGGRVRSLLLLLLAFCDVCSLIAFVLGVECSALVGD